MDSKVPGLTVDLEGVEKEEGEDYMFSKNEKSVRVTTLPQPRTVLFRYGERFQFSVDFWLMLITFFLLTD